MYQNTPIVVYSGAVSETDRQNTKESEADAFVLKPDVGKLPETIKYFLD